MYEKIIKYVSFITCAFMAVAVMTAWGDTTPVKTGMHMTPAALYGMPVEHEYADTALKELVDSAGNVITDTDGVLAPLMDKLLALRSGADSVVSILHVGDSHVQAGFWTARVRELFQKDFGNAGRGLIVPYKLAGGNEPPNYAVKTPYRYQSGKAVDKRGDEPAGISGVRVAFVGAEAGFEIWSKDPFCAVTVLHHERAPFITMDGSPDPGTYCTADNTATSTRLVLSREVDTVRLSGRISMEYDTPVFYGFSLENGRSGVLYHAIGANSAAFEHISSNTTLTEGGAAPLHPDLIIVSLGTNNCYGRNYRSDYFRSVAEGFVRKLKSAYPNSAVMLTTPMESCQRKSVKGRRVYMPNLNIPDAGKVLARVAEENGAAYWDMYTAAGSRDINEAWVKKGLMGRDRIHLTEAGYALQGDMMYDAFVRYYNNHITEERTGGNPDATNNMERNKQAAI